MQSINKRLSDESNRKRALLQTSKGREFCETALFLAEKYPWLMKTISKWSANETSSLYKKISSLVVESGDCIDLVDGYHSPPSDDFISLVASKAGHLFPYIGNAAKDALASMPVLGSALDLSRHKLQELVEAIRINKSIPSSRSDWKLVLRALLRDKEIEMFHRTTLQWLSTSDNWPIDLFYEKQLMRRRIRQEMVNAVEMAARVKELSEDLGLQEEVKLAMEAQSLDIQRTKIVGRIQKMAEELVDAKVVAELSRSFSAEAQSALIKFAQIAGKAKFSRSSQPAKMTVRQRRRRQEYLEAFEKCVRYIPCWILTSSQISDYLPSECLFDLVIIDEASQSDVTVLPGMLRGKQWLVVGDGKQVSPTDNFVAEEHIEILKAALPKSPLEDSLLPGHSFFDLCSQAFPSGRVSVSSRNAHNRT